MADDFQNDGDTLQPGGPHEELPNEVETGTIETSYAAAAPPHTPTESSGSDAASANDTALVNGEASVDGEAAADGAAPKARRKPAKRAAKRAAAEVPPEALSGESPRPRRRRRASAPAVEVLPTFEVDDHQASEPILTAEPAEASPETTREADEGLKVAEVAVLEVIEDTAEIAGIIDAEVVETVVVEVDDEAGAFEARSFGEHAVPMDVDVIDADVVEADSTELDPEGEPAADDTSAGAPPLASAFGLFFQAPTPPAPRRASRPAGAVSTRHTDEAPAPADEEPTAQTTAEPTEEPDEQAQAETDGRSRSRRRRGGRGRRPRAGEDSATEETTDESVDDAAGEATDAAEDDLSGDPNTARRRRRRRRSGAAGEGDDPPGTVTRVRETRRERDEPQGVRGSTRLEAKKLRRREGREAGRRRTIITEKEFLARRESVERVMVVRRQEGRTQIAVLEDGILVEHYVSRTTNASMAGNVYLGRVQNVLPSMEAAFVDIGRGRNAVLYAGEVNWDGAGLRSGEARRIENVLSSGESVLVQVTKDPIGHKGARLTSQVSLPGRYLVYVPQGSMTGISRKLPDTERGRLKSILREIVPADAGVIVRTAAEGASEDELRRDVERLAKTWERISAASAQKTGRKANTPTLLYAEPDLTVRVIRDVFNEDFASLVVSGDEVWAEISGYIEDVAPDLAPRMAKWTAEQDIFAAHRIDEQIAKALDRKVYLPSGGSLVIDRTEAMTVVDVNTGKFVGSGGNLEETVTKNNLEAAEEIVRQLRLRDIGGIIVIDFIDMVLESNRDLVVRRLLECLGRDRTKHQVAEVTSLGLVQMTRKRVASGLLEVFSEICEHCEGRGVIVRSHPVDRAVDGGSGAFDTGLPGSGSSGSAPSGSSDGGGRSRRGRGASVEGAGQARATEPSAPSRGGPTAAQIAAAAHAAAVKSQNRQELPSPETVDAIDPDLVEALGELGESDVHDPVTVESGESAETAAVGAAGGAAPVRLESHDRSAGERVTTGEPDSSADDGVTADGTLGIAGEGGARAPRSARGSRGNRRRGRATAPAGPPRPAGA